MFLGILGVLEAFFNFTKILLLLLLLLLSLEKGSDVDTDMEFLPEAGRMSVYVCHVHNIVEFL